MRTPRIFTTQSLETGATIQLEAAPSHHLSRVLRMQAGRAITIFNGRGGEFSAKIDSVTKKSVDIEVTGFRDINNNSALITELAIGISRNDRFDLILQKATELGVSHIIPIINQRTENTPKNSQEEKKWQRWQQVIISASEQCGRNILPELHAITKLEDYIPRATGEYKYVLHHRDTKSFDTSTKPNSVSLLIGSEGGLTEDEIDDSIKAGFTPLTLGPRILRTETAPIAAISLVQYFWGDLGSL